MKKTTLEDEIASERDAIASFVRNEVDALELKGRVAAGLPAGELRGKVLRVLDLDVAAKLKELAARVEVLDALEAKLATQKREQHAARKAG